MKKGLTLAVVDIELLHANFASDHTNNLVAIKCNLGDIVLEQLLFVPSGQPFEDERLY